jgi:hypothetical protein
VKGEGGRPDEVGTGHEDIYSGHLCRTIASLGVTVCVTVGVTVGVTLGCTATADSLWWASTSGHTEILRAWCGGEAECRKRLLVGMQQPNGMKFAC